MKKLFFSIVAGMVSVASFAQTWSLDKAHANVSFSIVHMMISDVDGNFKKFDATLTSAENLSNAAFTFSADVASISTGNEMRDGHLQGKDYFDGAATPTITFKSTSVKRTKGDNFTITGTFTMKGKSKTMVLNGTIKGPVDNPMSKKKMVGVKVMGKLKRSDFGIGDSGPGLSDEIEFKVSGEFAKD
ncbi:MAG: YceI family protein [Leadbetterella sp.]